MRLTREEWQWGVKGNKKKQREGPGEGEEGSSEQGEAREEGGMLLPISREVVNAFALASLPL
jgi:hypothetical protein